MYCVLAGPDALVLATRACFALGLSLPTTYVALEQRIGHTFKQDLRLSAVVAAARTPLMANCSGPAATRSATSSARP
ncbi:hypothetical protein QFZ82_007666 [Streptomyces sp. V4I23]|nr:hypothetical protein [Streptomyces sp. V4I23]